MLKRIIDVLLSFIALVLTLPIQVLVGLAIWLGDRRSPFYLHHRVGKNGRLFTMFKFRSMVVDADKTGVDSTSATDPRIIPMGGFIRATKLDELPQFWNVLRGDLSIVGPRPNVKRETDLYTKEEMRLLSVRPGITDISSIVFSDIGEIFKDSTDANLTYNQLVRPWKSRFGLFYTDHASPMLDIKLIVLTAVVILDREKALSWTQSVLRNLGAGEDLLRVASRKYPLVPTPPPGADRVVVSRGEA